VPQNAPQQIVPAAPTPQHIDPHYTNSPYYPSPSPYNTSGQCYSQTPPRNLQPPYLGEEKYDKFMTKKVSHSVFLMNDCVLQFFIFMIYCGYHATRNIQ